MMPRYARRPRNQTLPLPSGAILDHATLHVARGGVYRSMGKRLLDLSAVVLMAPVVLPLLAAAVLCLLAQGRSPFVIRSLAGRRGRSFQVRDLNLPGSAPLDGWLRKSGLDKAPRLWAVARGEMSLIGPRPCAAQYRTPVAPVLGALRPGLFLCDAEGSVDSALVYARDLSLGRDLHLLRKALKRPSTTPTQPECA